MKSQGLQPATKEAMDLLMEGTIAMSRIEEVGLRIDQRYLNTAIKDTKAKITELEKSVRHSKEFKVWARQYGEGMNLRSRSQLGKVIFDMLGHKRNPFLINKESKRKMNSEAAFEHLRLPFTKNYFDLEKLKKGLVTYLYGIKRELVGGRLHPFFDLYTAESYRSSSSKPNLHNFPVRNKSIAEIVRTSIIPRKGRIFIEVDYGSQEVRVSCCYNEDPTLRSYITGGGDMHTDQCKRLYLLTDEELDVKSKVGKMIRYAAKNMFVFAEFYGSYFAQCAPHLWDAISMLDLNTAQGKTLFEHLKSKGIKKLGRCDPEHEPVKGTFEYHVREVERQMWTEDFPVYNQWKKDWYALYLEQGGVNTLTGFTMYGYFKRNQILCDPIQGSAFHCLLWSLIQIMKEMKKRKMKSRIVNQVHDSMLFDAIPSEVPDLIEMVQRIAVRDVAKHWRWITVPLQTEFEICPNNWFEKSPLEMAA